MYNNIVRTAVHSVWADPVATVLGHKLTGAWQDETGNDFSTRIQGTRIRHWRGAASIKLYDPFGIMARVESTTNDGSFFKAPRRVQQREGNEVWKLTPLRKNLYSPRDLRKRIQAANERYRAFIAAMDHPDAGLKTLDEIARPVKDGGRSYRGFHLFLSDDHRLFLTLARGEWCIRGFRAADLRAQLPRLTPSRCSALLKRLRTHGLIKKVGYRYKYYLTEMRRRSLVSALNIRASTVLPSLCEVGA